MRSLLALITVSAILGVLAGCAAPARRAAEPVIVPASPELIAPSEERATGGVHHIVERGETLWRIAWVYGLTVDELARANGLSDPTRLEAGRTLFIPRALAEREVPPYPAPLPGAIAERRSGGGAPAGGDWIWPVADGTIVSFFGAPRGDHHHAGLDIRGSRGQPVLAGRAGRVVYSGAGMSGYGRTVILDHGGGLESLYAHNSELLVRLEQRVRRGQPIARVGRSGNASAEHCHFEIRELGVPVDPLTLLKRTARANP